MKNYTDNLIKSLEEDLATPEAKQAIADLIKDEWEAKSGYEKAINTLDNIDSKEASPINNVLKDIAKEEVVHVGELQKCLSTIEPDLEKDIEDGKAEAEENTEIATTEGLSEDFSLSDPGFNKTLIIPTKEDFDKLIARKADYEAKGRAVPFISTPWGLGNSIKDTYKAVRYLIVAATIKWNDLGKILVRTLTTKLGVSKDDLKEITKYVTSKVEEFQDFIPKDTTESLKPLDEKIVKKGSKWQVQSEKGRNMGTYDTKGEAEKRLKQVEYFKHLNEKVEKHDTLNPKLWNEDKTLKPEVEEKINAIVDAFLKDLEDNEIKFKVKDIKLVGSNASYNWNPKSDLDIHIEMDTDSLHCPDNLYPLLYSAYRSIWNKNHNIDFYGIPVEIFVETSDTEQQSKKPKGE